jgi:hypothetical protein
MRTPYRDELPKAGKVRMLPLKMSDRPEFDKPAFTPTKLEEERSVKHNDTVNVRLNSQERAMIEDTKHLLRMNNDSTALKLLAEIGHHVLHTTFSAGVLGYIASYRRVRKVV